MPTTIALFGSSRRLGNTGQLIDLVATMVDVEIVDLGQLRISPYDYDHRNRDDDFEPMMRRVLDFDQIIVASGLLVLGESPVKIFLDRISDYLEIPELLQGGRRLRGKVGYIVCTSVYESAPASFVDALRDTFQYLGMRFGGTLHANCSNGYSQQLFESEAAAFAARVRQIRDAE